MTRQKRTAIWLGVFGVGAGVGAYLWWENHKKQQPLITSSGPGVKRVPVAAIAPDAYTKGTPANDALTAAQNGWYAQHPDEPFVNDDGSCNILPEFDTGNIPGCLNQSPPSD